MKLVTPKPDEDKYEYLLRVGNDRKNGLVDLTWTEIADAMFDYYGDERTATAWRLWFSRHNLESSEEYYYEDVPDQSIEDTFSEAALFYEQKRQQFNRARASLNKQISVLSRRDELKDIANNVASIISTLAPLPKVTPVKSNYTQEKEGILCISDWHLGMGVDIKFNKFDFDVADQRISQLIEKTVKIIKEEKISKLRVVNLGDMIAGLIHNAIRLEAVEDEAAQTVRAARRLSELLNILSEYVPIEYYDTTDNHSRFDPNKDDSRNLDQFSYIIHAYLEDIFKNNNRININEFDTILMFKSFGHIICGVHGDKDKPSTAVQKLTGYLRQPLDLLLTAHRHHFSADDENLTIMVSNGSLMGTDANAENHRLRSNPSQNLIISTPENVFAKLYRIELN